MSIELVPIKKYSSNEKDIDTVLGILKRYDSENATFEMAIAILEELHANVHQLAHSDESRLHRKTPVEAMQTQ